MESRETVNCGTFRVGYNKLAHSWAYEHDKDFDVPRYGGGHKTSNMSTQGDICYSYRTQIARKYVDKQVLLIREGGWSTTTSRQQYILRRAFYHWTIIEVSDLDYRVAYRDCVTLMGDMLNSYKQNKWLVFSKQEDRRRFIQLSKTYTQLLEHFELTPDSASFDSDRQMMKARCEKYDEQREVSREIKRREARREAEKIAEQKASEAIVLFEATLSEEDTFSRLAQKAYIWSGLPLSYKLKTFRNKLKLSEDMQHTYFDFLFLGLNLLDGRFEYLTTRGCYAPIKDVQRLLLAWKAGKNIVGAKAGQYTILENTPEHIKVGCHTFPIQNIQALYEEMINENNNVQGA